MLAYFKNKEATMKEGLLSIYKEGVKQLAGTKRKEFIRVRHRILKRILWTHDSGIFVHDENSNVV